MSVGHQARHGLDAAFFRQRCAHEQYCGGAIIDSGSISSRHCAVFLDEDWLEPGEVVGRGTHAHVFIGVEDGLALASLFARRGRSASGSDLREWPFRHAGGIPVPRHLVVPD